MPADPGPGPGPDTDTGPGPDLGPDSDPRAAGDGRRFLIASVAAHYPKARHWNRQELVHDRRRIVRLFTRELGYELVARPAVNPTAAQLTEQLGAFARSEERRPDDLVAVYLAGHGHTRDEGRDHVLLTADSDPGNPYDGLPTADVVSTLLYGTRVRRLLLLLDACYSGQGGSEATAFVLDRIIRGWQSSTDAAFAVISATQPDEEAAVSAFPHLLAEAVASEAVAGRIPTALALDAVVDAMNKHPSRPQYHRVLLHQAGLTGRMPPFLPNPRRDGPPAAGPAAAAVDRRLLDRARGGLGYPRHPGEWRFTGRNRALADITAWLTAPPPDTPVLAVTAGPGSGKSAVLGLIAALAHPVHRPTVPLILPPDAVPPQGAITATVYAHGLTDAEVLSALAAAVGRVTGTAVGRATATGAGTAAGSVDELLSVLAAAAAGRAAHGTDGTDGTPGGRRVTVIVDAVDEAATRGSLIRTVLRPAVEGAGGWLRLLLGVRPHLLGELGIDRAETVDLDAPLYADLPALVLHTARNLAQGAPDSPYRTASRDQVQAVAAAVAAAAAPSFLVARITAAALAAEPALPPLPAADAPDGSDATDGSDGSDDPAWQAWRAWQAALPRIPGEAMRLDLETRFGAGTGRVRDLLRPLAFAEGAGLPWEGIWAAVAAGLAGVAYTDDDVRLVLRTAGSYVIEDTEAGRSAYRLHHPALAEHLRTGTDPRAAHGAITDALTGGVPRTADGAPDWALAHPYVLRHLATHAARAGRMDALAADPDYLVHAEPGALLPSLSTVRTGEGRAAAAVHRASADRHRLLDPAGRRSVLATDAARQGAEALRRALSGGQPWQVAWATARQTSPALRLVLGGHTDGVRALACHGTPHGGPFAVSADHGTLRAWDLTAGRPLGAWRTGVPVSALGAASAAGRPVALAAQGPAVRVWDAASGRERARFGEHRAAVRALACTTLAGRSVAVSGDDDGGAYAWDVATGRPLARYEGHRHPVTRAACGGGVAVTADAGGALHAWDLATGSPCGLPPRRTPSAADGPAGAPADAVALAVRGGRPLAVVATGDQEVWSWDLATGECATLGWDIGITAIACHDLPGGPAAVLASVDGTAKVVDLATGRRTSTLAGHTGRVTAVACARVGGEVLAVTGGADGGLRLWDTAPQPDPASGAALRGGSLAGSPGGSLAGFPGGSPGGSPGGDVRGVGWAEADGRAVVVAAGRSRCARVLDLHTGAPVRELTGPAAWAEALACAGPADRPVAVFPDSFGQTGVLRAWALRDGTVMVLGEPGRAAATAVACGGGDLPLAVTGDASGAVRVLDLATGAVVAAPDGHAAAVTSAAWTTFEGRPVAVTGSLDGTVRLWDPATGRPAAVLDGGAGPVAAVACAADGDGPLVVVGEAAGPVRVWAPGTGERPAVLGGTAGRVTAVACTVHDGRVLTAAAAGSCLRIWDPAAGPRPAVLAQPGDIGALAFGPGGALIAGCGWDVVVLRPGPEH